MSKSKMLMLIKIKMYIYNIKCIITEMKSGLRKQNM